MKRHLISKAALAVAIAAGSLNVAALGPGVAGKATARLTTSQIERLIVRIANREITRRARGLRVGSAASADRASSAVSAGVAASATNALNANFAGTANRASAANVADNATFATNANRATNADRAGVAASANTAASANVANFAASAHPAIFAKIRADGTVDPALSKGFTQANVITQLEARRLGLLCFKGVPGIKGATVTAETPQSDQRVLTSATASFTMGSPGNSSAGIGCPPGTEFGVETSACSFSDCARPINTGVFMVIYQ